MKILLGSVGILCVLVAGWVTAAPALGVWPAPVAIKAASVTENRPLRSGVTIGAICRISCHHAEFACRTPQDWLVSDKLVKAHDTVGLKQMLDNGDAIVLVDGTRVLVIDSFKDGALLYVRAVEGEFKDQAGWVAETLVKP